MSDAETWLARPGIDACVWIVGRLKLTRFFSTTPLVWLTNQVSTNYRSNARGENEKGGGNIDQEKGPITGG